MHLRYMKQMKMAITRWGWIWRPSWNELRSLLLDHFDIPLGKTFSRAQLRSRTIPRTWNLLVMKKATIVSSSNALPWFDLVVVKMLLLPNRGSTKVKLLHACLSHLAPSAIRVIWSLGIDNSMSANLHVLYVMFLCESCYVWIHAKLWKPALHAHEQTWMEGHVPLLLVVCSYITQDGTYLGSRYVLEFAHVANKRICLRTRYPRWEIGCL